MHEPSCRHPKIVPHHDDALHPPTVALPQGFDQFGVLVRRFRMEPLFKLVENDENLLTRKNPLSTAKSGDAVSKAEILLQTWTLLS